MLTFIVMHWSKETDLCNSYSQGCSMNSFHKIHPPDDYDDDTISYLSQEYSGNPTSLSATSMQFSMNYNNKSSHSPTSSTFTIQNPIEYLPSSDFKSFSSTSIYNSPFQSISSSFGSNLHQRISLQSYQYPEQCSMRMENHCQLPTNRISFQANQNFGNYRNEPQTSCLMKSLSNNSLHLIGNNNHPTISNDGYGAFRPVSSMSGMVSNYPQEMTETRPINGLKLNSIHGSHSTIPHSTNTWCNNINYNNKPSDLLRPTKFGGLHSGSSKRFNEDRLLLLNNATNQNGTSPLVQLNGTGGDGDNISRASSQSSGFDSQYDHTNQSRENSCGPDPLQRTLTKGDADRLTPDIVSTTPFWHNATTSLNNQRRTINNLPCGSNSLSSDSLFNLQAINEELPTIHA